MNFITQAEIVSKKMILDNVIELIVKPERLRPFTPGQFVQLSLDIVSASERWPESRTFSIANHSKDYLRFFIKNQGFYTNKIINETSLGTKVTIKYPFGEMFHKKYISCRNIFIAGGLGITPFLSLIEYFNSINNKNFHLFYSVKKTIEFIDLEKLKGSVENLHLFTTQEESKYTNRRINKDDLINLNIDVNDHFYICGSKEFINYFKDILIEYSISLENVHMDEWE